MENRISIYGHSGSYNHGNEAVVRGLCSIISPLKPDLYCTSPYIDRIFGLDEVCSLIYEGDKNVSKIRVIGDKGITKILKSDKIRFSYRYKALLENVNGIYLFTAEDQYCEPKRIVEWFEYENKEINRRGGKTIAVGATINEDLIGTRIPLEDLCRYQLVIARESITYNALQKHGINSVLIPCTAFAMREEKCHIPEDFDNVVGLNMGPLAQGNEIYNELYYQNCTELMRYILTDTDFKIALIPHMNWQDGISDFDTHDWLFNMFKQTGRVFNMSERNAPQQKYILGRCRMVVTTRTHVSVSSYAKAVPTLVTGYKQKSIGIAQDIFGTSDNYVMPIQDLSTKKDFVRGFKWLADNEERIGNQLKQIIPAYISRTKDIREEIKRVSF